MTGSPLAALRKRERSQEAELHGTNRFRRLPPVQRLLEAPLAARLIQVHGRPSVVEALRGVLSEARAALAADNAVAAPDAALLLGSAERRLAHGARGGLRRVINATGIVLHTNLGRAPLATEAVRAIIEAAGYTNLEFDLETGARASRGGPVEALLCDLTGAAASIVVNNGAAAILLALTALAREAEVVVSRGELVEIGGGFRIPELIRQGGARLVETGTTNRTRLADYAGAITAHTKVLLKVHQSNFRMLGFVEEATAAELAPLARARGLHLVVDLGSGQLAAGSGEPTIREAVATGALVTCSGDKLLGGPQAGLLLGDRETIGAIRAHPLLRALRPDKLALAGMQATLRLHRNAPSRVPVRQMMAQTEAELEGRLRRLLALLPGTGATPESSEAFAGGGALPGRGLPSRALAISCSDPDAFCRRLRLHDPPIIARIAAGRVQLDMLTLRDDEIETVAAALRAIVTAP